MHIAHISQPTPLQGFVTTTENLQVAIHCQFDGRDWEPLFAIKRGTGRIGLPSCFTLSDDAREALDIAADQYFNGGREDALDGRR
jgi:hypothetical protein